MTPTDILGNIKLYNADCMEVMKTFKDKQFDLAIIDPPYGIETRGNAQDRFRMGKSLSNINDNKPNKEYINELFRVSKNQIIWGYNHLSDMLPSCREFIFWYKHNPVVTFSDGELAWTSFQKTAVCFDYPYYGSINAEKFKFHPTTKPVQLYKWLLKNYAKEGDTILDTHSGSLSIGIACHDMKFDLTAIELDKDYYEQAKQRLINHQKQLTLF
jgi:site-specific DNA-methyltransferase (adenine-specific)